MGILPATRLAMDRAIAQLQPLPQYLLIDYVRLFRQMMPQKSIIKGDECSYSIAAASILAKVCRDHWMVEHCAEEFPQYGFEHHKGYGTQFHQEALENLVPVVSSEVISSHRFRISYLSEIISEKRALQASVFLIKSCIYGVITVPDFILVFLGIITIPSRT